MISRNRLKLSLHPARSDSANSFKACSASFNACSCFISCSSLMSRCAASIRSVLISNRACRSLRQKATHSTSRWRLCRRQSSSDPPHAVADLDAVIPSGQPANRQFLDKPSHVRDVQGAQQSGPGRTERQRSPEQPGPQGNARSSSFISHQVTCSENTQIHP